MNIYDISKLAGVSIATVSRVLNGSASVSEKTRNKVLDVMQQHGYTPNVFARGLGLNTMKTVGLLCTDASDIYQAKAIFHIEKLLSSHGYGSILCCSGYALQNKENCMALLLAKKVDALILIGSSFIYEDAVKDRYIAEAGKQVPVMLLNAALEENNVYGVLSNDSASVYHAAAHLVDSGRKEILYFYNSNSYSGKRKLAGYRSAMKERGLLDDRRIHFFGRPHEDIPGMARYLLQLRADGIRFDAVITSDDALALGVIKYAKKAGLRIPEDLAVIGYNNSVLACASDPELSSVDVRLDVLCKQLVSNLMQVLGGGQIPKNTLIDAELVCRDTTP